MSGRNLPALGKDLSQIIGGSQHPGHALNVVISWTPVKNEKGDVVRYIVDRLMCPLCGMISPSMTDDIMSYDQLDAEEAERARQSQPAEPGTPLEARKTGQKGTQSIKAKG